MNSSPRILIIGGGFSGLTAAWRLSVLRPEWNVELIEASGRLGGVARTERRDGYLIEHGPDMFTSKEPWAMELCREIGFEDRLISTNTENRRAFIAFRKRLHPVPEGFTMMTPTKIWPLAMTPLLSWSGKLRMAWEYFQPARSAEEGDESLADFARRRLGQEAYERLVQPLVGGVYTADPEKLSMAAALKPFVELERKHGGLLKAMRARRREGKENTKASGARYGVFCAPQEGMGSLVEALADKLPNGCVRLNTAAESIVRDAGNWRVRIGAAEETYQGVIVAAPAHHAAKLLQQDQTELAEELSQIPYAGASVVVAGYRRKHIRHRLNGFGLVAPMIENRRVLAVSFASVKFAGRAPEDQVLLRTFVGGACQPELAELSEKDTLQLVREELADLLGVEGEPVFDQVVRWRQAMPQYHLGHTDRIARIEKLAEALPNFELAGNAYRGVGIPFCIRSGNQAAERLTQE